MYLNIIMFYSFAVENYLYPCLSAIYPNEYFEGGLCQNLRSKLSIDLAIGVSLGP